MNNCVSIFHRHLSRGMVALEDESYPQAVLELEKALQSSPADDPLVFEAVAIKLMNCYDELNEPSKEERICRLRVEQNPQQPALHCDLGTCLLKQEKYRDAEGAFRQAIRLGDGACGAALIGLAHSLIGQGRSAEGLELFDSALRLDPAALALGANMLAFFVNNESSSRRRSKA